MDGFVVGQPDGLGVSLGELLSVVDGASVGLLMAGPALGWPSKEVGLGDEIPVGEFVATACVGRPVFAEKEDGCAVTGGAVIGGAVIGA